MYDTPWLNCIQGCPIYMYYKKEVNKFHIYLSSIPQSLLCICEWYDLYGRKNHMEYDRLRLATSQKTTPKSYDKSLNTNEIIF